MSDTPPDPRRGAPALFLAVNLLGGVAVLASYVYGMREPVFTAGMWGGVPEPLRPLYTVSMLAAAAGYFPMTAWVWLRAWPRGLRFLGLGFGWMVLCYGLILVASALWVPLTLEMLEAPGRGAWLAVRGVLAAAALGSLGVLAGLLLARPPDRGALWKLAVAGCVLFCNQTVLLDAIVWPWFFPTAD